ncbi:iron reductase [Irpex rosettiformis]|uniref:Iron reductase n=1 Tax=Irpex rosettiformis TaxID=378272 RepID=A0ACB8TU14_9APHY|nr:iron reductase [Irpex rosettiformis]
MSDFGSPPVIPIQFQQYNSYVEDPKWARKFSIIWATAVAIAVTVSLPKLLPAIWSRRAFTGIFGVTETSGGSYGAVPSSSEKAVLPRRKRNGLLAIFETAASTLRWTLPGLEVDFGQMLVVVGYLVAVLICVTMDAELISNANRGGFLALAQFPVVFLFATKNSIVSFLLGPGNGYERLNYVHRWAGRGLFICALIHGALWIRNHLQYGLPILGQQKETSGVAAFGVLCVIVLTSLRPPRRLFHQVFFISHVLGFVAFYITICYHTTYATPWIYPPLAFYGFDLLMRMFRYTIKDATLVPVDNQMTLIHIHDCNAGWEAGQHLRLRVFFNGRLFEAHPLSVVSAPPAISSIGTRSLTLAARVRGDWTRALNEYARAEQERISCCKENNSGVPVQVMFDGAYGGCSIDLGDYESVMLIAGGSGATFTIGMLDDIVGRCVKLGRAGGEKTRRVEFVWCIKSFGCIEWFSPMLMDIANAAAGSSLDIHFSIYVTCLCNPEAVPPIPNSEVNIYRPSISKMLRSLVTPPADIPVEESTEKGIQDSQDAKLQWVGLGGGVGVCASGPEGLIRETQNAVALIGTLKGIRLGGVGLHTELFAI